MISFLQGVDITILKKQEGGDSNRRRAWGKANLRGGVVLAVALSLLVAVLFSFFSCSSAGRENIKSESLSTPTFTGGPRISFDQDFIDMGKATPNQQLHIEFRFRNVGDALLEVYGMTKESLEGC